MAKRFKLKLSRVLPKFNSCKSKHPSNLPSNPSPFFMLSPINPKSIDIDFPTPPSHPPKPQQAQNFSLSRHLSSAILSVSCGCRAKSSIHTTDSSSSPPPPSQLPQPTTFKWKKDEKYHVITNTSNTTHRRKIYISDESDDNIPLTPPPETLTTTTTKKKKKYPKKKPKQKVRFSTSSADSGLFSTGEEQEGEETETLVSSSSTDFDAHLETIRETPMKKKKKKRNRGRRVKRLGSDPDSPARLSSVLQKLMPCKVEGKVKESFAVVKKSDDPYEDFKRSMVEMILEKEMFDVGDLEQLLHCFLSLNSRNHHEVIVEAFTEIWEALFCKSSVNQNV